MWCRKAIIRLGIPRITIITSWMEMEEGMHFSRGGLLGIYLDRYTVCDGRSIRVFQAVKKSPRMGWNRSGRIGWMLLRP